MVKLFVVLGKESLDCGLFKNELTALKWFLKNKHSFQDLDGEYGEPVTVKAKKR